MDIQAANTYHSYNPLLTGRAQFLRKNSTKTEIFLWQKLKARQLLGYKFIRQKPIGRYIVDFYCHELKLVIEIDGFTHDEKLAYDAERNRYLKKQGLTIIHFLDKEVKENIDTIIQRIVDVIER